MYVGLYKVPKEIGKQCFDPDVVIQIIQSEAKPEDFIDDKRNYNQPTGQDVTIGENGIILFAKNKDTLIRGLQSAAGKYIKSDKGTIILAQGHYGEVSWKRAKGSIVMRTPYLAKLIANYAVLKAKAKGGYTDWSSQSDATHKIARALIRRRGYFVFAMGRAAFTGPPPVSTLTYVGDYKTSWPALATLVGQGKDV
jgi:hypothetical protein